MSVLKNAIFNLLPSWLKSSLFRLRAKLFDVYAIKSYSQEGEDMILRRLFEGQDHGFYVDIGAHHPCRFSNTYFFYKRGWSGINIEPNPDAIRAFQSFRKRDINIQVGVSDQSGTLTYFEFNEPALNTFDPIVAKSRQTSTPYKLLKSQDIPVERLDSLLHKYLPPKRVVDFMTIDVEGLDFNVLKSNNWKVVRPKYVLVELLSKSLVDAIEGEIYKYMKSKNYDLFAKTYNTFIFCDLGTSKYSDKKK